MSQHTTITTITPMITLIGSLANIERIQKLDDDLAACGLNTNSSWTWHGPDPDKFYCKNVVRKRMSYSEAMKHRVAKSVFDLDRSFIDDSAAIVLVLPAGKSAITELGYAWKKGKKVFVIEGSNPSESVLNKFPESLCPLMNRVFSYDEDPSIIASVISAFL